MNKNFLASSNKRLEDIEKFNRRMNNAKYLIGIIKSSKLDSRKIDMIRNLYFYLDFHFVLDSLKEIYLSPNTSSRVKAAIKALHDGTMDVNDLIEETIDNQKIFDECERLSREFDIEASIDSQLAILDKNLKPDQISLLRYDARTKNSN